MKSFCGWSLIKGSTVSAFTGDYQTNALHICIYLTSEKASTVHKKLLICVEGDHAAVCHVSLSVSHSNDLTLNHVFYRKHYDVVVQPRFDKWQCGRLPPGQYDWTSALLRPL